MSLFKRMAASWKHFGASLGRGSERTRIQITREGWQFIFMLAFIVFAAILQNINLLILMAGALAAMLFLQWRLTVRTLAGVRVRRQLPAEVEARTPFPVALELYNASHWLGCWLLNVRDEVASGPATRDRRAPGSRWQTLLEHLLPQQEQVVKYQCEVPARGRYHLRGLQLSTRFPLSLMLGRCGIELQDAFVARPKSGQLLPGWRRVLQLPVSGQSQYRSRHAGTDGDFYSLRDYRLGDPLRLVHWRTSAKRDHLVVRQLERLEFRALHLIIDFHRDAEWSELVAEVAATILAHIVMEEKSQAMLTLVGPEPKAWPVQSRPQLAVALNELAVAEVQREDWLSPTLRFVQRSQATSNPALVITTRAVTNHAAANDPLAAKGRVEPVSIAGFDFDSEGRTIHPVWLSVQDSLLLECFKRG